MTTSQHRFGIAALLLGMALLPVITLSQSENKDLGIVRVRYVTIVVRDYDEALNWYKSALGLEGGGEGALAPRETFSDSVRGGSRGAHKKEARSFGSAPKGERGGGL